MNAFGVKRWGILLLAIGLSFATEALAQDFYEGKKITLVIASGPGGATDLYGRLVARHLGNHLPGHPTIIAKNMTGAGGIVGLNYIYNQAPNDGTELAATIGAVPFAPLFAGVDDGGKSVRFDSLKLQWLGSPSPFVGVAIAWHTSPVKHWKDLEAQQLIVGSSGMGASSTVDAVFLKNLLGLKYHVILGYRSGADVDLAMERGETQGRANTDWYGLKGRHQQWIDEKKVLVLYQEGLSRDPSVPETVPLLIDGVSDPEKRAILEMKMAVYEAGYPLCAPPEVPKDRAALLREAVAATYSDGAYLADAERAKLGTTSMRGEALARVIAGPFAAPEPMKEKLRAMLVPESTSIEMNAAASPPVRPSP
jgi:tripartite-type tricarboxylate transporter receptor subunit TctC